MTAPKKIIFYHNCFAIPANVWLLPETDPVDIVLQQAMAFDLPREFNFKVVNRKLLHFPDFFHKHLDTLHSIMEAIRHLGVHILFRIDRVK